MRLCAKAVLKKARRRDRTFSTRTWRNRDLRQTKIEDADLL